MPSAIVLLAAGVVLGVAAIALWFWSRRARAEPDAFSALGTSAEAVRTRSKPPPVDLSQPIKTPQQWSAMRAHASDTAYRRAVETLRLRYQIVSNPMLLSNTLSETMRRGGLSFREAVLRVAEDDGLRVRG